MIVYGKHQRLFICQVQYYLRLTCRVHVGAVAAGVQAMTLLHPETTRRRCRLPAEVTAQVKLQITANVTAHDHTSQGILQVSR